MCHVLILFYYNSMIKMKVIKTFHVLSNIGFPLKGKLIRSNFVLVWYVTAPFIYLFENKFLYSDIPVNECCKVLGPVQAHCLFINYQSTLKQASITIAL
jgi:hypothetical protein